jgi:hypothetical protein
MTVPDLDVRVEAVTESHVVPYVALSRAEYGDAPNASPAYIRWKYLANPQGPSLGIHLLREGELIGRLVAQPRAFSAPQGAGEAIAAYMVELLIHPSHRGMASLAALLSGLQELRSRFDFILVTPNAAGILVWRNFVKLPAPFELGVYAIPLRPGRLAGRLLGGAARLSSPLGDALWRPLLRGTAAVRSARRLVLDPLWPADAELDALLAQTFPTAAGRRDRTFLDWRFRRSPAAAYDVVFLRRDGALVGYVVTRRAVYAGYDTSFVIDAFGTPRLGPRDWTAVAWSLVRREMRRDGPELVLILGNGECAPLSRLIRAPFVSVPRKLLPQSTPVFAEWWSEPAFPLRADALQLTLADCDMF